MAGAVNTDTTLLGCLFQGGVAGAVNTYHTAGLFVSGWSSWWGKYILHCWVVCFRVEWLVR